MKKIGLLVLAVVLALGSLGIGYAYWSDSLDIGQNPVETGEFNVCLKAYLGLETSPYVTLSPRAAYFPGTSTKSHSFTLSGIYPSFGSGCFGPNSFWVLYTAVNTGTIPAKVASVDFTGTSPWLELQTYSAGVPDEVKLAAIDEINASTEIPADEKDEIIQSIENDWKVGDVLGTQWLNRLGVLFIRLHVVSDGSVEVPENGSGTVTVTTTFTQVNAP